MPWFKQVPPPKTNLGRYRILSPNAAIRVSPLQLGAMSIGDKWNDISGYMDKDSSFKLLDTFYDAGGNFIDTANAYQDGSSEEFIGEWMEQRGIRDQMVIATKYTTNYMNGNTAVKQQVSFMGNNVKSMTMSIDASLKKLRTHYVDIFYVHWWDWLTSIPEVMDGLHNLVVQGKVLYLGVSDTPAWVVTKANQYARDHGKTPFVIYQGPWNVMERELERDVIPMARAEGMAIAPWNVLASGKLRSDKEEEQRRKTGEKGRDWFKTGWERNDNERKMSAALENVAEEVGASSPGAVAIAYVMQKAPYVFPLVGGRKVEHLLANIEALSISLSDKQIEYIESIIPYDFGFMRFVIGDGIKTWNYSVSFTAPSLDNVDIVQPIRPKDAQ